MIQSKKNSSVFKGVQISYDLLRERRRRHIGVITEEKYGKLSLNGII